jgi:BatD DUF11 like domain
VNRPVYILTFFVVLLAANGAQAQQKAAVPQIGITLDREPLVQGEPFTLSINIESESGEDPEIRLPRFGGLRVLRKSESHPTSFHFSFGFGKKRQQVTKRQSKYSFVLVADKAGKFKIDPVTVTLDGKQYRGDSYNIQVIKSSAAMSGNFGSTGLQPVSPDTPNDVPQGEKVDVAEMEGAKIAKDYFIQTAVSKKNLVVGEPMVLTIFLYTSLNISDLDVVREPGTEGFWVENLLSGNRRLTTEPVDVGGKQYDRAVLRKYVAFPIKPGTLTIAPTIVELEVRRGGFFSKRRSVKRASLPITVEVSDLPAEGQPAGFDPANVGHYSFKATVDRTAVKSGEPVTLTLVASGEGNLRNLVLPTVENVDGFKTYAPESDLDVKIRGDRVTGTRSSRVLMIAREPGTFEIPVIAWPYFSPLKNKYQILKSRPLKITVDDGESRPVAKTLEEQPKDKSAPGQDRLNRQLRSILSRSDLEDSGVHMTMTRPWFIIFIVGLLLVYLAIVFSSKTKSRLAENRLKGRSKRAESEAKKRLNSLARKPEEIATEKFFAELERSLVVFLEDRLEVQVAGDTNTELRRRLVDRGIPAGLAEQVVSEIEACDFARFARRGGAMDERQHALRRMQKLISLIASQKVTVPMVEE